MREPSGAQQERGRTTARAPSPSQQERPTPNQAFIPPRRLWPSPDPGLDPTLATSAKLRSRSGFHLGDFGQAQIQVWIPPWRLWPSSDPGLDPTLAALAKRRSRPDPALATFSGATCRPAGLRSPRRPSAPAAERSAIGALPNGLVILNQHPPDLFHWRRRPLWAGLFGCRARLRASCPQAR